LKILVIGAGDVGFELSKLLSDEKHDVVIMDQDEECLKKISENLDVLTINGNATSPVDLVEAQVKSADVMIAVTNIDEVNIVSSVMAKRLGARTVIARVRNDELSRSDSPLSPSELGIDILIHPELAAAREIALLLKRASATDVVSLADNRLQLIGLRLKASSKLIDMTLEEVAKKIDEVPFRLVALSRRGNTVIPKGSNRLKQMDNLFILCKTDDVEKFIRLTGHKDEKFENILISGGSEVGELLARELSEDPHGWNIKLIEPNLNKATILANELRNVLVLNGNPTDPNLLVTEGINEMDAFISVTQDEESNIISCLMAKHLEVKKTVAIVSRPEYLPLSETIGLDAAINVKASASDEIHRCIRKGNITIIKALKGIKAEVFEVVASNKCKVINHPLHKLKLPDGAILGGVIKENNSVEIATGTTVIHPGDKVIVFALPYAIDKVISLFQ